MKELTIEEKAKRYNSMFERLKEMYNNNKTNVAARLICERYFPELKESEDEKIRKELLVWLTNRDGQTLPIDRYNAAIAWLEKQCEQKPAEWSEEDENYLNTTIAYLKDANEFKKTAEKCITWLKSLRSQNNITEKELAQAKKNAYNDALDKIEYHSGEPTFDDGWSAAIDYIQKKSLRPQNRWKPSDEQMDALESAVSSLQSTALESLYNKLKKL